MLATILMVVFGLVFVAGLGLRKSKDSDLRTSAGFAILAGILGVLVVGGISMTYFVKSTEIGVPISLGKVGKPIQSGPGFKAPWTEIVTLPIRPFTLPEDIVVNARTDQGGRFTVTYGARWVVKPEEASNVYLQVRTGDEDKISRDLVEKALATAVGNVYVQYDNSTASTARVDSEEKVLSEVNRLLSAYGVGVTQVFLRQADPDEKTQDALNRLSASVNETLIAQQDVQTATQEGLAAKARAEGAKSALDQFPANLTPEQVTLYCAQLWAEAQRSAVDKGQTLWTTPCGSVSGNPTPLVNTAG